MQKRLRDDPSLVFILAAITSRSSPLWLNGGNSLPGRLPRWPPRPAVHATAPARDGALVVPSKTCSVEFAVSAGGRAMGRIRMQLGWVGGWGGDGQADGWMEFLWVDSSRLNLRGKPRRKRLFTAAGFARDAISITVLGPGEHFPMNAACRWLQCKAQIQRSSNSVEVVYRRCLEDVERHVKNMDYGPLPKPLRKPTAIVDTPRRAQRG